MREKTESVSQNLVFAADLGGTYLRVALVDESGKIHHQAKQRTPKGDSPDCVVDALVSAVEEWRSDDESPRIAAASIMVPGTVDNENAVMVQAPNLPALAGYPLK